MPYSGISGSKLVASSPKRIAGICAFHRLYVPRSPPSAFLFLTLFDHVFQTRALSELNVQICGDKRSRTADIWLAKPTLYQLSYTPGKMDWSAPGGNELQDFKINHRTRNAASKNPDELGCFFGAPEGIFAKSIFSYRHALSHVASPEERSIYLAWESVAHCHFGAVHKMA